jgi:hypothetical protein
MRQWPHPAGGIDIEAGGLVVDGHTRWHWDLPERAALEDVVVHCARGYAVGTSVVAKVSRPAVRPRAFKIGDRGGDVGRVLHRYCTAGRSTSGWFKSNAGDSERMRGIEVKL